MTKMKNENNNEVEQFESACLAVRKANRAITQFYNRMMAPSGLNVTQFSCLQAIDRGEEIAQCNMARSHTLSVETLSRRLTSLKIKGLVAMRLGSTRNQRVYRLTPAGKLLLAKAEPFWLRAQSDLGRTQME
jgi:DNA-binding MarR family transcriptional regulator